MTEFALVAPVLLLLTFGIIDFGRALYFFAATGAAAAEAAHEAMRASDPMPTDSQITAIAAAHFPGATFLAPSPNCVNGPIPAGIPPVGDAWLFITDPNPAVIGETSPASDAPGGEIAPGPGGSCNTVVPAIGRQELEVTLIYNFVPVTPLVSSVIGNHVVFIAHVLGRTEY